MTEPTSAEIRAAVYVNLHYIEDVRKTDPRPVRGDIAALAIDHERLERECERLREALEHAVEWADWLAHGPQYTPIMKADWPDEARALLAERGEG